MAATALQNNFGSTWLYIYQNVGIQSPTLWPHVVAWCALCTVRLPLIPKTWIGFPQTSGFLVIIFIKYCTVSICTVCTPGTSLCTLMPAEAAILQLQQAYCTYSWLWRAIHLQLYDSSRQGTLKRTLILLHSVPQCYIIYTRQV